MLSRWDATVRGHTLTQAVFLTSEADVHLFLADDDSKVFHIIVLLLADFGSLSPIFVHNLLLVAADLLLLHSQTWLQKITLQI